MLSRVYSNFGQIGLQTIELSALEHLKYPHRLPYNGGKGVSTFSYLFTPKYFDDFTCWLSGEQSLPFGAKLSKLKMQ